MNDNSSESGRVVPLEPSRPEYKAPAAEKALDILEFMAARPEGATQTEISIGLGRSISEVYRIIQLLEKRGYLIKSPADRYRLSLKLFELAHAHPPVNRLIDAALPVMRSLVLNTDQSCHLVVISELRALVLLQVDSPLPMRYSVALGSQFPVLETSSGAVLVATMREPERSELLERIFDADESEETREDVAKRLSKIVELDYEMRASLAVEGCTNISVPIRDHRDETVAALTVPYLKQKKVRFDRANVLASAREAAFDISRALGGSSTTDLRSRPRDVRNGRA